MGTIENNKLAPCWLSLIRGPVNPEASWVIWAHPAELIPSEGYGLSLTIGSIEENLECLAKGTQRRPCLPKTLPYTPLKFFTFLKGRMFL